jgi:predicted RNase H-like HicB family nuclease
MDPIEILKQPYARVLTPEQDGHYTAEILEFPGCVAYGDSSNDALGNLEEVAAEWIAAAIEQGQNIPEPTANIDYSGRLVVRMSKGLHRRAAICAEREGVSLNQFIVTCLAEAVGERAQQAGASRHVNAVVQEFSRPMVDTTRGI